MVYAICLRPANCNEVTPGKQNVYGLPSKKLKIGKPAVVKVTATNTFFQKPIVDEDPCEPWSEEPNDLPECFSKQHRFSHDDEDRSWACKTFNDIINLISLISTNGQ